MEELHEVLTDKITSFVQRYVDNSQKLLAAEELAIIVSFGIAKTRESLIDEFDRVLCASNRKRQDLIDELSHPPGN